MPNCVVKGCRNQSSRNKKQDGITFHTFPKRDIKMKQKWIAMIRQSRNEPLWQPTSCSVICSAHFETEYFYNTNKGLRRIVKNGYPKVLPNIIETSDNEDVKPTIPVEDFAALDGSISSNVLNLNEPTTSYAVPTVTLDLLVLNSNQASTACAVQPIQLHSTTFDTPREHRLRKRVAILETLQHNNSKKIKTLNQKVRRLQKRNKSLKEKLNNLKKPKKFLSIPVTTATHHGD